MSPKITGFPDTGKSFPYSILTERWLCEMHHFLFLIIAEWFGRRRGVEVKNSNRGKTSDIRAWNLLLLTLKLG